MRLPAEKFLTVRAFGAPAIVITLAAQGTFRGFKDTKTPLIAVCKYCIFNICFYVTYSWIFFYCLYKGLHYSYSISSYTTKPYGLTLFVIAIQLSQTVYFSVLVTNSLRSFPIPFSECDGCQIGGSWTSSIAQRFFISSIK